MRRGMYNPMSATGDLIIGGVLGVPIRLAAATDTWVLTLVAGSPAWAAPVTSVGTVTSVSVVTANGISGTVATATTTPAITLTLGAITPTSTNGVSAATMAFLDATSSIQTQLNLKAPLASPAFTGTPTAPTATPANNSTQLATTAYVDSAILGQNFKEAVGAATTANLVGVYVNGVAGVGATFTYTATGVDTIDGITLTLGMRVLLKNQTTDLQNGIYTVTTAGAIGVAGILTRATDADQTTDFKTGDSVFVTAGTTLSATTWAYTGIDLPTMGTTSLTYVQVAGQGSFTGGTGITITGTSIAINTAVTADLSTSQSFTNKNLTGAGNTFPTLNQNTTGTAAGLSVTLAIASGGTGATTLAGANIATYAGTETFTNKRITKRIGTEASSGTSTPTADTVDQWNVTALAVADAFAAPTGTPTDGQELIIRIKDNATARALTWNAIYRASSDLALPTTTILSKTLYLGFKYNAADLKWDLIALLNNF